MNFSDLRAVGIEDGGVGVVFFRGKNREGDGTGDETEYEEEIHGAGDERPTAPSELAEGYRSCGE